MSSTTVRSSAVAGLVAAAVLLGIYAFSQKPSYAEGTKAAVKVSIRYIGVSGTGPTANAWYDGAPPGGVLLQSALDTFAEQGYRIARATDPVTSTAGGPHWFILLERVGS